MKMRNKALVATAVLVMAAMLPSAEASGESAGRYIVVLNDWVSDPQVVASEHANQHALEVAHVYRDTLKGYSAVIPPQRLNSVRDDARVDFIEEDGLVQIAHHKDGHDKGGPQPSPSPTDPPQACPGNQEIAWGIERVGGESSSALSGDCKGEVTDVNIYVIDTGVQADHPDLNVVNHVTLAKGPNKDCHGHGTHVAGIAAARDNLSHVVGIAPGAPITGVRVTSCGGTGWASDFIAGVEWVTANKVLPAVVNVSLTYSGTDAIDQAVLASIDAGIVYSLAGGNQGNDHCPGSPRRTGINDGSIVVGATDSADEDPDWSNTGTCIDLWAPGVDILSTYKGSSTAVFSGTSMSAPHVSGAAALYLAANPGATPAAVENAIKDAAILPGTYDNGGIRPILLLQVGAF